MLKKLLDKIHGLFTLHIALFKRDGKKVNGSAYIFAALGVVVWSFVPLVFLPKKIWSRLMRFKKRAIIKKYKGKVLAQDYRGKIIDVKCLSDDKHFISFVYELDSDESTLTQQGLKFLKEYYGFDKIAQMILKEVRGGSDLRFSSKEEMIEWMEGKVE